MRPNGPFAKFFFGALGLFLGVLLDALLGPLIGPLVGSSQLYLLLTLLALGLILRALEPLARKRGWGSEGRLTRYLSRPPLIDESKRLGVDPGHGS
jgi:hypothetical protein